MMGKRFLRSTKTDEFRLFWKIAAKVLRAVDMDQGINSSAFGMNEFEISEMFADVAHPAKSGLFCDLHPNFIGLDHAQLLARFFLDHFKTFLQVLDFNSQLLVYRLCLGTAEAESIIAERGRVDVGCEFCGAQYGFDPVDAAQIFTSQTSQTSQLPPPETVQ